MGTQLPLPKRCGAPQFLAHVYCGQTAGWIKMALGIEVGVGPGHIVLDGDPAPLRKGGGAPIFDQRLLWLNGCMDQDATWYGGRPRPTRRGLRDIVLDGDPARPRKKAHPPQAIFGPCLLWPNGWLNQDAT